MQELLSEDDDFNNYRVDYQKIMPMFLQKGGGTLQSVSLGKAVWVSKSVIWRLESNKSDTGVLMPVTSTSCSCVWSAKNHVVDFFKPTARKFPSS